MSYEIDATPLDAEVPVEDGTPEGDTPLDDTPAVDPDLDGDGASDLSDEPAPKTPEDGDPANDPTPATPDANQLIQEQLSTLTKQMDGLQSMTGRWGTELGESRKANAEIKQRQTELEQVKADQAEIVKQNQAFEQYLGPEFDELPPSQRAVAMRDLTTNHVLNHPQLTRFAGNMETRMQQMEATFKSQTDERNILSEFADLAPDLFKSEQAIPEFHKAAEEYVAELKQRGIDPSTTSWENAKSAILGKLRKKLSADAPATPTNPGVTTKHLQRGSADADADDPYGVGDGADWGFTPR